MKIATCVAGGVALMLAVAASAQTPQTPPPTQTTPPAQAAPRKPRPAAPTPIQIIVRDLSGTPIEGAKVSLSGPATRELKTDNAGVVRLASLPAGLYRIRFEHDNFITLEREVTIRAGQPPEIDAALTAAPPPPPPPPPPPSPAPEPKPAPVEAGPPAFVAIPAFLDRNFIGRDPLKESVLGCTPSSTTRVLQLRDNLAVHTHADLDETIYVIAGEGAIHVRDESNPLAAGSLSVIPRGTPHSLERRGRNPLIVLSLLSGQACQARELSR